MNKHGLARELTRREMLRLSAIGATALAAKLILPDAIASASPVTASAHPAAEASLYANLLHTWCDGLLTHQLSLPDPALHGALLCPACGIIHGRCGDAVYPLLRMAQTTGNAKYLQAALAVHNWSERNVSRDDGSWVNDVTLSGWQGITVFRSIALAEALHHHGNVLDAATRRQWTDRLARAAKFLDGFISIETGNINYPVTSSLAFTLCGQVLGEPRYLDRGQKLAYTALNYFTPSGFLAGEGHPLDGVSAKHCRPVDLGYNVEESLPALALYAKLTGDQAVLDQVIASMRTHMEFMLPDGGWDNSWGTRNYKWSYWGSRTSDGCQPAFVLLAGHDPRFREAARRNTELMAACTHDGLLYGGPDYATHGDQPCIHHAFTHAKALATVLDRGSDELHSVERPALPRDEAYGVKTYSEIATHLAAVGNWRATVTGYDWEYVEHVQAGGGSSSGGHATGGALSMLHCVGLGPVLTASMTDYQMIEISNQQAFGDAPHMSLTPRIECVSDSAYTSQNDFEAVMTMKDTPGEAAFDAKGRLLTASHKPVPGGDVHYRLGYRIRESGVEIAASADASPAPLRFILPVIARSTEAVTQLDAKTIRIARDKGMLTIRTDAAQGFESVPKERTFNLVPGFECAPLEIAMQPGKEIRIWIEASLTKKAAASTKT